MTSPLKTYLLANKMMLFICICIILYPLIVILFSINIACQYKLLYGIPCRSCGLTRGLFMCFKGNFIKANFLNPQSTFIFISLITQLLVRMFLIRLSNFKLFVKSYKRLFILDITILLSLFVTNKYFYG
jgi:hypothetical protein